MIICNQGVVTVTDSLERIEEDAHNLFFGGYTDGGIMYCKLHGIEVREGLVTTNYEGHALATAVDDLLQRQREVLERDRG